MFSNYRLDEPRSDKSVTIDKLSYLSAGFFGPAYVLFKAGPRLLLQSLAWSIGCAFGTFAFVVKGLPHIPGNLHSFVLVVGIPAVFLLHSAKTVGLVRRTYLLRKWIPRRPD